MDVMKLSDISSLSNFVLQNLFIILKVRNIYGVYYRHYNQVGFPQQSVEEEKGEKDRKKIKSQLYGRDLTISRYILMFYSIFFIKFVFLLVSLFFHGCRISRRPLERAELNNTTVRQIFDILILMQCMKKSLQDDDVWTHPQKKLKFFYLCIYVAHSVFSKWGKLCIMIFRNQYRIRYIAKNNFNVFSFFLISSSVLSFLQK